MMLQVYNTAFQSKPTSYKWDTQTTDMLFCFDFDLDRMNLSQLDILKMYLHTKQRMF